MEKLRLKALHSKGEVLSSAQLKKVLGGTGSRMGSESVCGPDECQVDSDCGRFLFCRSAYCYDRPSKPYMKFCASIGS